MSKVYLNVGSGQRPFQKPWINIDTQEKWRRVTEEEGCAFMSTKQADFLPNSVDMIVLHHMLEHVGCGEADALIEECHETLTIGGSLIVCVPDVRELSRAYVTGRMDTQLYMTNMYGAYMGDPADRHKWGYDADSLGIYLLKWKWASVRKFNFRPIEGADIAKDWWILGMECVK